MHIVELRVQNVLNLKAVRIRPDGAAVILTGDNEAGKSAVLDSIFMALTGKKVDVPIRKGQERGEVIVDLGEIIVKKVWTAKTETLEISNSKGAVFGSPQTLLDNVLGRLSFNPIEFAGLSKTAEGRRQQREILARLAGLDFSKLDKKRCQLMTNRTEMSRDLRRDKANLAATTRPTDDISNEEISLSGEMKKVRALEVKRDAYDSVAQFKRSHEKLIADCRDEQTKVAREITRLQGQLKALEVREEKLADEIVDKEYPEKVTDKDVKKARNEMSLIEDKNKVIRAAQLFRSTEQAVLSIEEDCDALTAKIEAIDLKKVNQVNAAKFPVPGLSIDDEKVIYNGLPFDQQSTARQYMLSTAICMSLNPKLKDILLRDASVLGKKIFKDICTMAERRGYRIWVEMVDPSGKVGILIEDGEIRAINGKKVKKIKQVAE